MIAFLISPLCVAESIPEIPLEPLKIVFVPTADHKFQDDSAHTQDGKITYDAIGAISPMGNTAIAPAVKTTPNTTIPGALSNLLAAYQAKDIAKIRSLYTADSASFIDSILSNPPVKERWLEMIGTIRELSLLMIMEDEGKLMVVTSWSDGNVLPFFMVREGTEYRFVGGPIGQSLLRTNLLLALVNYKLKVSEIAQPIGKPQKLVPNDNLRTDLNPRTGQPRS